MPIVKRRFGRNPSDIHNASTSHVIKCGWKRPDRDLPMKLPGLLICKEAVGGDGRNVIDYEAMSSLGCSRQDIDAALKTGEKAPSGSLPTELVVRVAHGAKWVGFDDGEGYWTFPGTFDESYQCWKKEGIFCAGDGHRAMRTQPDMTKAQIECVPAGALDADPAAYCPISVRGECKPKGTLILRPCTYREPSPSERQKGVASWQLVEPLLPVAGLARLVTGSDYSLMGIRASLDEAADRLQGRIAGLSGVLGVSLRRRRTEKGAANVPSISLSFNEEELIARERMLYQIESERRAAMVAIEAPAGRGEKTLALPAPADEDDAVDAPAPSDEELATDEQPVEAEWIDDVADDDEAQVQRLIEIATRLAEENDEWFMGMREVVEAASEFRSGHRVSKPEDFLRHKGTDAKKHAISMKWLGKTIERLETDGWAPAENWESMFGGEA